MIDSSKLCKTERSNVVRFNNTEKFSPTHVFSPQEQTNRSHGKKDQQILKCKI